MSGLRVFLFWFGIAALGYSLTFLWWPESILHGGWLWQDQGWYLAQLDQLLSGASLYTEVATPYGPWPYWWQLGWAKLLGNRAEVFVASQIFLLSVSSGVAGLALFRLLRPGQAAAGLLLGVIPFQAKILAEMIYSPLTALQLALLLWAWRHPGRRTFGRAFALGILLGVGQWIKFGHFLIFGAGMMVADLAAVRVAGNWKQDWRRLLNQWFAVAIGAALPELVLVGWVGWTRPGAIAWDVIWPAYQSQAYGIFGPEERLWKGLFLMPLKPLAGRVLPALFLATLSAVVFGFLCRRGTKPARSGDSVDPQQLAARFALFIPVAAYIFGGISLFTSTNHLIIYHYLLGWGVPWLWTAGKSPWALGAKGLCIACALLTPVGWISNASAGRARCAMPGGEVLWLDPKTRASWAEVERLAAKRLPPEAPVLFLHWHGLNHYLKHPAPGRHAYPLPGWVRPHETASLQASIETCVAVVAPCHRQNEALRSASRPDLQAAAQAWRQLPEPLRSVVATRVAALEVFDGWMVLWLGEARD